MATPKLFGISLWPLEPEEGVTGDDPTIHSYPMDFQLHQLSASNIASIFNSAFIDAEAPEDGDYCLVKDERVTLVCAYKEQNLLRFNHFVPGPSDLNEEALKSFVNAINNRLSMLKVYIGDEKDKDGDWIMIFEYDHIAFGHSSISAKTIIQLHRLFGSVIDSSYQIYRELFMASSK
ncbi:hypothetical protein [Prochlorococcus marinus]|uniref:hypothetical protein n=1 Tax=Prochlorococcus marinus TaxID=1219 RepID=UPI0007B3A2F4|nr:hypothetical protein [Prochlorococcus marinus]KZR67280.1 hypothetical protein PMIT1312_00571 [Prochlorococcus marinus str. MIT 1312]